MKKPLTVAAVCLSLFLASAWISFALLDHTSVESAYSERPNAPHGAKSNLPAGTPNSRSAATANGAQAFEFSSQPRSMPVVPGVTASMTSGTSDQVKDWAKLEFEFMMLTKPRTLDSKDFGGSNGALASFAARIMSDPANRRLAEEGERLAAEYKQSDDMQRRRQIVDSLKMLRENIMAMMKLEVKNEQELIRVTGGQRRGTTKGSGRY